tara:strand:- start:362 stop:487 length:126 start_codon:yes stop_codon:yes gene_type:complete
MINFLKRNKKLWLPSVIIILLIVIMFILSKYGFNPLGYVIY